MNAHDNRVMPDLCSRRSHFHFATALNVLMKMGVDIHRVNIIAEGEYANYRGEVHSQEPKPGTPLTDQTAINLRVGFNSAVDCMPYQFFYGFGGTTDRTGDWDEPSRALMAPFDSAVIRYRSLARRQTLKFSMGVIDIKHLLAIMSLYGFEMYESDPDPAAALLWVSILPEFNHWAGQPRLVEEVLHRLFGYQFRIRENVAGKFEIPDELRTRLGAPACRLGHSATLGRSFVERDSTYELTISGVKPEEALRLMPGRSVRKKLEWALEICMPNHLECRLKIRVDQKGLPLGNKQGRSRLGYASRI